MDRDRGCGRYSWGAVSKRIAALFLCAIVLMGILAVPASAIRYYKHYASNDNSWTGGFDSSADPLGSANSAYDASTGLLQVYAEITATYPGYEAVSWAKAWVQRDFRYEHDHDWINTFTVGYWLQGDMGKTGTSDSDFFVKVQLYHVNEPYGTETLLHTRIDFRKEDVIGYFDGSKRYVTFRYLLESEEKYRVRVTAYAKSWVRDTEEGSAYIDFMYGMNCKVNVHSLVVEHTHCILEAKGGNQSGPSASAAWYPQQDSYPYANGVIFNSKNYYEDAGDITGYRTYINNCESGSHYQTDYQTVHYNADVGGCEEIPRGYKNYIHVTHYLENQPPEMDCNNDCRIANLTWKEGSSALLKANGSNVIPDHGSKLLDPLDIGGGQYTHSFLMVNDDPLDTLRISSLTFYATMDEYDDPAMVPFPDSIHQYSLLGPLDELPLEIVTDGDLIGGHIYFSYSISDAFSGDSVICSAWGDHQVVADPRYFVTGDEIYSIDDFENDTMVVFQIWNDVSELPTRDFGYYISSMGHFDPAVAKTDTVYGVSFGGYAEVHGAIDATGATLGEQDTVLIVAWPLDSAGVYASKRTTAINNDPTTDSGDQPTAPGAFRLWQNHPNPFNPVTRIKYNLPVDCNVRLDIYDVLGRRITTLVNGRQTAGSRQASWDGTNNDGVTVASGIYFYRLEAGSFVETRKMVLLR